MTDPEEGAKRSRGLSLVMTPRNQPTVHVRRIELMGMRAACTCEVFLDGARAPADAGACRWPGPRLARVASHTGRGTHSVRGHVRRHHRAALEQALQYARDRHAFGRPIGAFQAVQHPLADIATELEQIRLITAKAAWLQSARPDCAIGGRNGEARGKPRPRCAPPTAAMRVLGGYGLVEVTAIERLFRDARLGAIQPDLERNGAQLRR